MNINQLLTKSRANYNICWSDYESWRPAYTQFMVLRDLDQYSIYTIYLSLYLFIYILFIYIYTYVQHTNLYVPRVLDSWLSSKLSRWFNHPSVSPYWKPIIYPIWSPHCYCQVRFPKRCCVFTMNRSGILWEFNHNIRPWTIYSIK